MFYGLGREKGGLTAKPVVSVSAQSSSSDVANTLLGTQFVVGGTRPRQKLHSVSCSPFDELELQINTIEIYPKVFTSVSGTGSTRRPNITIMQVKVRFL